MSTPEALDYAVCLDARGYYAEAAELRRQHAEIERLTAERDALADSCEAKADRIDRLGEMVERLTVQRDQARGQYQRAVELLTAVHSLLYPPPLSVSGRVMVFRPDGLDPHLILQDLSDRIRALPDELAEIRAALQQPKEPSNG